VKVWRAPAALIVAGVLALVTAGGLGAQTADQDRIDDQIRSLREHVTEASAEEARLLGLIDQSTARKRELDAKVAGFDRQITAVQRDLDDAQARLDVLVARQRGTEVRLGEATAALEEAKAELRRQAIAAYTGGSEAARYAAMLLESSTMGELASKRFYIKAVVGTQSEAVAADSRSRTATWASKSTFRASTWSRTALRWDSSVAASWRTASWASRLCCSRARWPSITLRCDAAAALDRSSSSRRSLTSSRSRSSAATASDWVPTTALM
jgi:septal ring factor EnvC (AmiA/AmiB activator)